MHGLLRGGKRWGLWSKVDMRACPSPHVLATTLSRGFEIQTRVQITNEAQLAHKTNQRILSTAEKKRQRRSSSFLALHRFCFLSHGSRWFCGQTDLREHLCGLDYMIASGSEKKWLSRWRWRGGTLESRNTMKGHFLIEAHLITWGCQYHPASFQTYSLTVTSLWQSNFSNKCCYLTLSWLNICASSLTWADRFSGGLCVISDSSPARSTSWVRSSSAEYWLLTWTWISTEVVAPPQHRRQTSLSFPVKGHANAASGHIW